MSLSALFDFARKDIDIDRKSVPDLLLEKHADYIHAYEGKKESYTYISSEHLRMSGVYWCLTSMDLLGQLDRMNKVEILSFVLGCQHPCGGFAASDDARINDPHLLHTLSALQILALFDSLDRVDSDGVYQYICSLQQEDGSFTGDKWGEVDTRFSFCAVAALRLLGRCLPQEAANRAANYVRRCRNADDGGFGTRPGSESHAGQVYCCVGALALLGKLDDAHLGSRDRVARWLCERQCGSGGLNGRPEKLPDVCYSWWVLASLAMVGRLHWVDSESLTTFILACQDVDAGGIADRPGDMSDPFHTVFGLAGLSLLGDGRLKPVNPVLCMPEDCLIRHRIDIPLLT